MLNTDAEDRRGGRQAAGAADLRAGRDRGPVPAAPRIDEVLVVGTYTTPQSDDVWHAAHPATSTNEQSSLTGGYQPYQPAPLLTTPETVAALGPGAWTVRVDTPLDVPADLTRADLDAAAATAARARRAAPRSRAAPSSASPTSTTSAAVRDEVRYQQATARARSRPPCCRWCSSPSRC